ncbi:hypothetical protein ACIPN8_09495 [Streptomyces sp. NPDC086082]|uniref:hypothetical protein n=1 Tax=Streptomyces sp. NPDC086082 TaxID=3365750 RepID=UPI00382C7855
MTGPSGGIDAKWIAFAGAILAAIIGGIFLLFVHDGGLGLTQNGDNNKGCQQVQTCEQK